MQPTDFVRAVRQECSKAILDYHAKGLQAQSLPPGSDPKWIRADDLFRRCSEEDRQSILFLMRVANLDGIASLFGVIDSGFVGDGTPFTLTHTETGAVVSGDLVDEFWAQEGNA